jgi:elongin-B
MVSNKSFHRPVAEYVAKKQPNFDLKRVFFSFAYKVFLLNLFQDVFMMIRRKKTTIFTDAKDTTTVHELKKMIEGILKVAPRDQRLYSKDNTIMEDDKQLQDYGITMTNAKAQQPAVLGLALRTDHSDFEPLELIPYSQPPDLPEVMKQDAANGEQA